MSLFGIFGEKWQRIGSVSPWILRVEGSREAGGAFSYSRLEEQETIEIQRLVSEHKVTAALRLFSRWLLHTHKAEQKQVKVGMTQVFQYFHAVKATNHFIKSLEAFILHANKVGGKFKQRVDEFVQAILPRMIQHMEEIELWGGVDLKTLMAIMNAAKEKKSANPVAALRTAFKRKVNISRLGRVAMRSDIRVELKDERAIEHLSTRLEEINSRMEKEGPKAYEKIFTDFEAIMAESDKDILDMYRAGHLIMKRDLLLILLVLSDEKTMRQFSEEWISKHFMPEAPMIEGVAKMDKLNNELFDKAHTIANGLGVIMKNLRDTEAKLNQDLRLAA